MAEIPPIMPSLPRPVGSRGDKGERDRQEQLLYLSTVRLAVTMMVMTVMRTGEVILTRSSAAISVNKDEMNDDNER